MIGPLADALLIVLLVVALVSVHKLNRRMGEMREGRAALEKLAADLGKQTEAAAQTLAAFRSNAESLGKPLEAGAERGRQVIAEVQRVSDDLRLLIGRAEASTNRLELAIGDARKSEALLGALQDRPVPRERGVQPAAVPGATAAAGAPASREAPAVSPEAAAFLSSLSGMR
jgi:ABC-type transporter Mla subunit MlaD